MNASSALFELINSLEQGEKRYFRLFANRHVMQEENKYLTLFDAVARQASYDEAQLKAEFAGTSLGKYFANIKNYLYKMILQAMREYHRDKSRERKLRDKLYDVRFLRDKRLYPQALKLLRKTLKEAEKYEFYDLSIEALLIERRLIFQTESAALGQRVAANLARADAARTAAEQMAQYRQLTDRAFLLARTEFNLQRKASQTRLQALLDHPLISDPPTLHSFLARIAVPEIRAILAQLQGNALAAWTARRAIIHHWQAAPNQVAQRPNHYLTAMANYLATCHQADRYDDFLDIVHQLKTFPNPTPDQEAEIFQNVYYYEFLYLLNHGEFEACTALVPTIETGMQRYAGKINPSRLLAFQYNIAILYFVMEHFRDALRWINKIVNHPRSEHRKDIQQVSKILLLILHFELRNTDLLEYLIRSTLRFLSKSDGNGRFERFITESLNQILNGFGRKFDLKTALQNMEAALTSILADPAEQNAPGINELKLWLTAKTQNRSIAEIFRSN